MDPIIIIGSGLAGYTLAREFRKLDQQTPLHIITADDGRYYSKPQLSSAFSHSKSADALSMANSAQMAKQLHAMVRNHSKVTHIDTLQQRVLIGRESLSYSKLILACGADVIKLAFEKSIPNHVCSVNNLQDYCNFRNKLLNKKRIAIIGAGFVGCEFANDLYNGGYHIDIIALSLTPLDTLLPPAAGKALQKIFAEHDIQWHLENTIIDAQSKGDQCLLTLSNQQQLKVDIVLSAVGLRPNLTLANTAAIETQRGITVDHFLQTSAKNVYALGDCAEVMGHVLLFVAPLVHSARALAHTLAGKITPVHYPPMPIVIKTPLCPVVVATPPASIQGRWDIQGEGKDIKALFYDQSRQLWGFALTGTSVVEKMTLVKELPDLLPL